MKNFLLVLIAFIAHTMAESENVGFAFGIGGNPMTDMNPHPPFEEPKNMWGLNESLPENQQLIQITDELYDELITTRWGANLASTPWVLVFVRKDHIDCKRAVTSYGALAESLGGSVRFGWVDRGQSELLAETFSVRQLPATFLIKDGMAYHYRDWPYSGNLLRYLEEDGYQNSSLSFKQPGRFYTYQLYTYAYPISKCHLWFRIHFEQPLHQWQVKYGFSQTKPRAGATILYRVGLTILLVCVWLFLRFLNRFKTRNPAEVSTSYADVKQKRQ